MMRPLLLAAVRALFVRGRRQPVMGTAHVPPGWRGFSFWNRHGGKTPSIGRMRLRGASIGRKLRKNKPGSEAETAFRFNPA
jgi:hypothetical protein